MVHGDKIRQRVRIESSVSKSDGKGHMHTTNPAYAEERRESVTELQTLEIQMDHYAPAWLRGRGR